MIEQRDRTQIEELRAKARRVYGLLVAEYGEPAWRPRSDPLSELVQTILSQHTADVNSQRGFGELRSRFPNWHEVRDAPAQQVAEAIRSAGLANIKAPRIQRVLRELSQDGRLDLEFLRDMPPAEAKAWLMSLPGVGPKTAACVLVFSLGKPAIPVDTHVYRVSRRLGLIGPRVSADQSHEQLEALLAPQQYYTFHVNMVAHGRRVCHAQRPAHEVCVLRNECDYYLSGTPLAELKPTR